jgi:hypothetical protein
MYSEDDPYLAEVRKLCLALPESVEVEAWGRPTFRAGKEDVRGVRRRRRP